MELYELAVERTKQLFINKTPVCVACSFGKDSSLVLAITLEAAIRAKALGHSPFIAVTHADTMVENPAMRAYADREIEKLMAYKDRIGINLEVMVSTPALNDGWAVRVLSGRAMPSFPGNSDCSVSWKVKPMEKLVKELLSSLETKFEKEPCTVIGTRFVRPPTPLLS